MAVEKDKLFCDGGGNEFIKVVLFLLVGSRAVLTAVYLDFTQSAVHGLTIAVQILC